MVKTSSTGIMNGLSTVFRKRDVVIDRLHDSMIFFWASSSPSIALRALPTMIGVSSRGIGTRSRVREFPFDEFDQFVMSTMSALFREPTILGRRPDG
jgi:hypothetical protein